MTVPMERRMCSPSREEREVGSFRNMSWLYMPYMLAREDPMPDQSLHILSSFNAICSITSVVCFKKSSLCQDKGISVEIE